jgi:hypothetical protein
MTERVKKLRKGKPPSRKKLTPSQIAEREIALKRKAEAKLAERNDKLQRFIRAKKFAQGAK